MGKKFAPNYANLFLAEGEEKALECVLKPSVYWRFLDDIWEHSKEEFYKFANILNTHHPSICEGRVELGIKPYF